MRQQQQSPAGLGAGGQATYTRDTWRARLRCQGPTPPGPPDSSLRPLFQDWETQQPSGRHGNKRREPGNVRFQARPKMQQPGKMPGKELSEMETSDLPGAEVQTLVAKTLSECGRRTGEF